MSNDMNSEFSYERKSKIIEDLINGMSHKDIEEKYQIKERMIRRYAAEARAKSNLPLPRSGSSKDNFVVDWKSYSYYGKESEKEDLNTLKDALEEKSKPGFMRVTQKVSSSRKTEDLIELLKTESQRKFAAEESKRNIDVQVTIDGPIAISFFGDPHIDNEGCDWTQLENDLNIVKNTEGMFAGNVGDQTDNWVGRLAKLFQNQKITRSEALQLVEWLFKEVPWLFIVMGNHDHWNADTGNVLDYIFRLAEVPGYKVEHDARFNLKFPNGNTATVRARHNFKGRSVMNPVHSMVKETQLNVKDDILICGDWHHTGYQPIYYNEGGKGFANGGPILCHAIRVGTYKRYDEYAIECGFKEENWSANMVAIIDPYAEFARDKVKVEFSPEAGAERLSYMRSKFKGTSKKLYS